MPSYELLSELYRAAFPDADMSEREKTEQRWRLANRVVPGWSLYARAERDFFGKQDPLNEGYRFSEIPGLKYAGERLEQATAATYLQRIFGVDLDRVQAIATVSDEKIREHDRSKARQNISMEAVEIGINRWEVLQAYKRETDQVRKQMLRQDAIDLGRMMYEKAKEWYAENQTKPTAKDLLDKYEFWMENAEASQTLSRLERGVIEAPTLPDRLDLWTTLLLAPGAQKLPLSTHRKMMEITKSNTPEKLQQWRLTAPDAFRRWVAAQRKVGYLTERRATAPR